MVSIKDRKILRQMFSHYDYVMTTAQLSKEKLYYRDIQRMLGAGLIEKVKRGYYHWTMGSGKGDVVIISRLFPDGILCMETALFYYGYSDRNPAEWNIAIDKNTSRQRTRIDYPSVKAYRIEPTILSIGARKNLLSKRNCGKSRRAAKNRKRTKALPPWTKAELPTGLRVPTARPNTNSPREKRNTKNPKKRGKQV